MVYSEKGTGSAGVMRIDFDGTTVRFYLYGGYSSTYHYDSMDWSGTVNGVAVGGTGGASGTGPKWGAGSKAAPGLLFGAWTANYGSQTVTFTLGATGTSGLGGPTTHSYAIYRAYPATAPPAPSPIGLSNITPTSMQYQFSGNGDGGSGIIRWEYEYSTTSNFSSGNSGAIASSGTSTATGLANHTTYYFRSRGVNAVGAGGWSGTISAATTGHPSAPLGLTATASTTVSGRIALDWSQPSVTGAGGIVGYTVLRNGSQIGSTTGTGTAYTDNTATPHTTYTYTVTARNAYSQSVGGMGPASNSASAVGPGVPTAPRTLIAVEDDTIPGKVDLSWLPPTTTGAGGITGYRIYFSGGSLIANQNGTATSYSVTGLAPGSTYSFQVFARNAVGDASGTWSPGSNTAGATPIGEPQAPTGVTVVPSANTSNRLVISWSAPPGTLSGYNVFQRVGSTDTLLQRLNNTHNSYAVDNLVPGFAYTFVVRARTVYTDTLGDGYPGNWGGPASSAVSAVPSNDSNQIVPNVGGATSGTNAYFAGTYTLSAVTSNTMSYAKNAPNIATTASGGSVANVTNAVFNGTYNILSFPTPAKFTYSKANADIPLLAIFNGNVTNNTNASLNINAGTVTAVNAGAHTFSYAKTGADLATVSVPVNAEGNKSVVVNITNASFNVSGKVITAISEYTVSYNQTGADVPAGNAAGTITNVTNRDVYNGVHTILSVLSHNSFTYTVEPNTEPGGTRIWVAPNGTVEREDSAAVLEVRYRSGWIG